MNFSRYKKNVGNPVNSWNIPKIFPSKLELITKSSIGKLYVCNLQVNKAKIFGENQQEWIYETGMLIQWFYIWAIEVVDWY